MPTFCPWCWSILRAARASRLVVAFLPSVFLPLLLAQLQCQPHNRRRSNLEYRYLVEAVRPRIQRHSPRCRRQTPVRTQCKLTTTRLRRRTHSRGTRKRCRPSTRTATLRWYRCVRRTSRKYYVLHQFHEPARSHAYVSPRHATTFSLVMGCVPMLFVPVPTSTTSMTALESPCTARLRLCKTLVTCAAGLCWGRPEHGKAEGRRCGLI